MLAGMEPCSEPGERGDGRLWVVLVSQMSAGHVRGAPQARQGTVAQALGGGRDLGEGVERCRRVGRAEYGHDGAVGAALVLGDVQGACGSGRRCERLHAGRRVGACKRACEELRCQPRAPVGKMAKLPGALSSLVRPTASLKVLLL